MWKIGSTINLGRLFGIQFRLHFTWFIIFVLIAFSLSWRVFPTLYPDWTGFVYWIIGIVTSLLFFASILAHELAHSLVGRANDIPIRSITLFIFGGVAQTLTIQHDSMSRESFMPGVCLACKKVVGLNKLYYGLENIL